MHPNLKKRVKIESKFEEYLSEIPCQVNSDALNSVMSGQLSRRIARWKYSTGEDAGYLQIDEKTLEALLQLDIEYMFLLRSVDGRIWDVSFGGRWSDSEIPFFKNIYSNLSGKNAWWQYLVGSFSGALSFGI